MASFGLHRMHPKLVVQNPTVEQVLHYTHPSARHYTQARATFAMLPSDAATVLRIPDPRTTKGKTMALDILNPAGPSLNNNPTNHHHSGLILYGFIHFYLRIVD